MNSSMYVYAVGLWINGLRYTNLAITFVRCYFKFAYVFTLLNILYIYICHQHLRFLEWSIDDPPTLFAVVLWTCPRSCRPGLLLKLWLTFDSTKKRIIVSWNSKTSKVTKSHTRDPIATRCGFHLLHPRLVCARVVLTQLFESKLAAIEIISVILQGSIRIVTEDLFALAAHYDFIS